MQRAVLSLLLWLCGNAIAASGPATTQTVPPEPASSAVPQTPGIELDLLAIDLNGQQVSRGTLVHTSPGRCLVQVDALETHLASPTLPVITHDGERLFHLTPPAHCTRDDTQGRLQVSLPAHWLKEQALRLSSARQPDPLALLLGPREDDSPTEITSLTAAHLDLIADRHRQQWALGAAHQGLQFLMTDSPQDRQAARATLDWLWPSGGALRIGDQVVREGPDQRPRTLRGVSASSRLQVLRPHGSGQGQVVLDAPARLQFFDTQGQPLFSTGLLPSGRYRLEGLGAPILPGLLAVRVEGLSGQTETLLLPWVASPLLLGPGATHWDLWMGEIREGASDTESPIHAERPLQIEGLWARGMSLHETVRSGWGYGTDQTVRGFLGITSQRWPRILASGDLGFLCMHARCTTPVGLDISGQPRTGVHWSGGLRYEAGSGLTTRLSVSQRLSQRTALTAQVSQAQTRLGLLSLQTRLSPEASLQASLRSGSASLERPSQTSIFLSLHLSLPHRSSAQSNAPAARARLSSSLQARHGQTSGAVSYQQPLGPSASSPRMSATKAFGPGAREELRLQHQGHWGDLTLQARQPNGQPATIDASVASRLWVTPRGLHWGAVGDHNLVIHELGHPDLRVQLGRQTRKSNHEGLAAFGRTPAWTEAQFRLDAESIPFEMQWKTGQVRFATAARRAYWVDQRQHAEQLPEFRLRLPNNLLARIRTIQTQRQRPVAFTPEGYLDMVSLAELPLTLTLDSGQTHTCDADKQTLDQGAPVHWVDCPTLEADPPPRGNRIREAQSSPRPSSG
jgi:hypothetical protein